MVLSNLLFASLRWFLCISERVSRLYESGGLSVFLSGLCSSVYVSVVVVVVVVVAVAVVVVVAAGVNGQDQKVDELRSSIVGF